MAIFIFFFLRLAWGVVFFRFFLLSSEFDSNLIDEMRWLVGLWRFITSLGLFSPPTPNSERLFTHAKIWQKFETRVNGFIFKRFSSGERRRDRWGKIMFWLQRFSATEGWIYIFFIMERKEKCVLHDGDDVMLNYYMCSMEAFMKNRVSSKYRRRQCFFIPWKRFIRMRPVFIWVSFLQQQQQALWVLEGISYMTTEFHPLEKIDSL